MKIMNNNDKLAKIAVNKSLLKEYSNSSNERIVYMHDGTEFQIQIFNPYSYVIGVSFKFNNNSESSQLLVLRPGERVWLDRYLDNESRLLFSTYEVGASEEVKKAIKDNGNLQIKFYKEREKNYWNNHIYVNQPIINAEPYKHIDVWYSNNLGSSYCLNNENDNVRCFSSEVNTLGAASSVNFCQSADTALNIDGSITGAASTATYTATSAITDAYEKSTPISAKVRSKKSIETGRIEEGSHSNQRFNNVYKDFETWPFKTEYIKILPFSQKQVNANDISKRYCYNCGRKLNQKYNFCPFCGAKQ